MTTYRVDLEVYQGPLDLLLRLIEREELDITTVSLAVVTDQYLAYLAEVRERSAAQLADFLQVAGRLLVLKSRVLLPRPEEQAEGDELLADEDDLVAQLREYKRFKETAAKLREIEASGFRTYPRAAPPPRIEPRLKPGEVGIEELVAAFRQVLDAQPPTQPVDDVIAPLSVHIRDCIVLILDRVARYPRARFSTLLRSARSRQEVIVTFLALLELIKQQRVRASQERPFGEIYLEAREPEPGVTTDIMELETSYDD
ncbi:MAG: segregation and condensation protein A [Anaerolineae bacterium]